MMAHHRVNELTLPAPVIREYQPQLLLAFLLLLPLVLVWPLTNKTELPQWHLASLFSSLAILAWLLVDRRPLRWTWLHTLVTALLIVVLFSTIGHSGKPGTTDALQQQVTLTLFFFLGAIYLSRPAGQLRLLQITVASASIVALIGIAQHLTGSTLGLPARSLNASVFINKNYAGGFMNLATPTALWLLLSARTKMERTLAGGGFLVCLSYSLITLSRGHWLALAASLTVLLFLIRRNPAIRGRLLAARQNQWLAAGVMVLAPLMLVIPTMGDDSRLTPETLSYQLGSQVTVTARLDFYRNTAALIQDHPLMGIGAGAFYTGFRSYYGQPRVLTVTTEQVGIAHAHNDYLEYLAELGIIGGGVAIALVLGIGIAAWSLANNREDDEQAMTGAAFLAGTTAILGHALVDFPLSLPASSIFFWTWAGAISGAWQKPIPSSARRRPRISIAILVLFYLGISMTQSYRTLKADYLVSRAIVATTRGECPTALLRSDEAFRLAPRSYPIWHHYLLVSNYCNPSLKGQFLAAAEVLERDPNHPYALLTSANALYQAGDMERAAVQYGKLLRLLPHRISGYLGMANVRLAQGDGENAQELYRQAETIKQRIGRRWATGPAGKTLAALTVDTTGNAQWTPPGRRRPRLPTEVTVAAPPQTDSGDLPGRAKPDPTHSDAPTGLNE